MILFGASGHSRSVIDVAQSIGENITLIYDDNPIVEAICHIPVVKYENARPSESETWLVAIGDNKTRQKISRRITKNFGLLVHRTAYVSPWSFLGDGTVVMAHAAINSNTSIGEHCIVNTGAVIEHDCIVDDFVHISPNVSLAGGVSVGEGTHIGIGACVIPEVKIGKWATIGAGAVIIKDVPDGAVVVGNPGRVIKMKEY